MRSELFSADNLEKESAQPGLRLQNSKMLKVELNGEIMARRGAMVAYQGQVQFQALGSGGIGKWLKSKVTGEGVPLMKMTGRGDVFLANEAQDIHLIDLEPATTRCPSTAPTCWPSTRPCSTTSRWCRAWACSPRAGLFNCVFSGTRPDRHHHQGHARSCCRWTSRPTPTRRPRSAGRPACRPATTGPSSSAWAR